MMLRLSLAHGLKGTVFSAVPTPMASFGQGCLRQFTSCVVRTQAGLARPSFIRAVSAPLTSIAQGCIGQQSSRSRPQTRLLHTSTVLHARTSFLNRAREKIQRLREDPNVQQKLVGVGATGYAVTKVAKFGVVAKYAFPALKLTKAMPLMSMGLTTVCYTCFFGLPFAVGIVGVLASSNASRALLLRRFGCEVPPSMMIPFFGTMNSDSGNTDYTKTEQYILADQPFKRCLVILAPVAGMLVFTAAAPFGAGGFLLGSQCGFAVASTGFMMGMFSLLPLGEMTSGGQLLNYFSKNALLLGTLFNVVLMLTLSHPLLYLCFFLNLWRIYQRGFMLFGREFGGNSEASPDTIAAGLAIRSFSDQQKLAIASMYWGLFLLNAGGMMLVGKFLATPQQLRAQKAEASEQRLALDPTSPFSSPPPSEMGGWGVGDWAMNNLQAVEKFDRDEDDSVDWWEQNQRQAAQNIPADELFAEQRRQGR